MNSTIYKSIKMLAEVRGIKVSQNGGEICADNIKSATNLIHFRNDVELYLDRHNLDNKVVTSYNPYKVVISGGN